MNKIKIPFKSFYFIRHGETDWNQKNIIMGQTDIPLNETGRQQAREASANLQKINFSNIYSSPLLRAHQTAEILNEDHKHSLILDSGLMERKWGKYEGDDHKFFLTGLKNDELPQGAETYDEFQLRVLKAVTEILNESPSLPLIVAHGGVFVALTKHFGILNLRAANCSIHSFTPPQNLDLPWSIHNLTHQVSDQIRHATKQDINWMVDLSHAKRVQYEEHQKEFWKMAKNSDEIQTKWFEEELEKENVIALCTKDQSGFVIGKLISPPEVYDAGLTLMIDDFCVRFADLWMSIGAELLGEIKSESKIKGAKQVLVVCGDFDSAKYQLLEKLNLSVASRWYAGSI
jgi:broad specificity phosphatase PhoE